MKDKIYVGYSMITPYAWQGDPFDTCDGITHVFDFEKFKEYARQIANTGINFWGLIPWGVWCQWLYDRYGINGVFQPYMLLGDRFDLTNWNDYYWPTVRKIVEILNDFGITVRFELYDSCQFHGPYRMYSPWFKNCQDFFVPSFGEQMPVEGYPYVAAFVNKALGELAGLDVMFGLGNEMMDTELAINCIMPIIRDHGINPARMWYGAVMAGGKYDPVAGKFALPAWDAQGIIKGRIEQVYASTQWAGESMASAKCAYIRPVHGALAKPTAEESRYGFTYGLAVHQALIFWAGNINMRFSLEDDGTGDGDNIFDTDGRLQRPDKYQWRYGIRFCLSWIRDQETLAGQPLTHTPIGPKITFNHLPKNIDLAIQLPVCREMCQAVEEYFNAPMYNYNRYPVPFIPDDPEEPEEPLPPKLVEVIKDHNALWHLIRGDFKRFWRHVRGKGHDHNNFIGEPTEWIIIERKS